MAAWFSKGKMARASLAPDRSARADGDVARRADLRPAFAMGDWRQCHGPALFLRNHFRTGCITPGRADRSGRLDRHQKRKTGVEDWIVSHGTQPYRHPVVCDQSRPAHANVSPGRKGRWRPIAALGYRYRAPDRLGLSRRHD